MMRSFYQKFLINLMFLSLRMDGWMNG